MTYDECWALLKNFVRAGSQRKMALEEWETLQALIPKLQGRPVEDIMS